MIKLDRTVVQGGDYIVSDMGGEKVMLSVQNGKYYNLGVMGGLIWDLAKEPVEIANVVDVLLQQFEVERELCEEQVLSFLSELAAEGLVQIRE